MGDMNATQKAQNLARIRDNQRRSRARRKEYLQELEAKLRACEQTGIEASAEIQSAARKVLDENKKLRTLLQERGVSEGDIVATLGGTPERSYEQISCAPTLTTMLERRITCGNLPSCTSSPISSNARSASLPRHPPSVPPISIPRTSAPLSNNDSPSPNSMVSSSMGTPPPGYNSQPFYTAPATPPAPEIKSEDIPYNYPYEQAYPSSWTYTNDVHDAHDAHDAHYVADSTGYFNTTSCVDAANIIRTMRSDIGPELENELGCQVPEQDCYVNNSVVFNMMDKYSNQQGNM